MQEFGTEALGALRKACTGLVRKGECRMECETLGAQKEAALKPLEEAAEAFGAWQTYNRCVCDGKFELAKRARENLIHECCDVIQATASLMSLFANGDEETYSTMRRMRENNMKRGGYGARR